MGVPSPTARRIQSVRAAFGHASGFFDESQPAPNLTPSWQRGAVMLTFRRMRCLLVMSALFALSATARAHDPYESFTLATVRDGELELNMTMAQSTAIRLIDSTGIVAGLSVENFPKFRERFATEARTMWVVTSLKAPLVVRKVIVELTEENDISIRIFYPRPALGRLHFHAAFLKKLGEGYGGILDTADTEGRQLGWEQISWENPNLEVTVFSIVPPKKK